MSEVLDRMTKISVQCGELEKIVLGSENDKYFQIGTQLPLAEKEEFLVFLRNNLDVSTRSTYEALRVDLEFICHHLNVNLAITPRRQQPRRSSKEHAEVVKEEFNKLKKAGAIKEVFYPKWLANTVVVKRKSGKWKVCVNFTDFNKACPKDPFPVPKIDQLFNVTFGHPWMSFLDAFQDYH